MMVTNPIAMTTCTRAAHLALACLLATGYCQSPVIGQQNVSHRLASSNRKSLERPCPHGAQLVSLLSHEQDSAHANPASHLVKEPQNGQQLEQPVGERDTMAGSILKTFIRTNNMRAYHLDLHSYRPEAKYAGDPEFVDSRNDEHKLRCRRDLMQFQSAIRSTNELDPINQKTSLDALRLADSFGRPEAGVLEGNQFWLGSIGACQASRLFDWPNSSQTQVMGQYCLGVSQFPNWNPQDTLTSFKVALCLPETCTSSMINESVELLAMVESMMLQQFPKQGPFRRLELRSVYCLPHETSEIRQYDNSARLLLAVLATFVGASLLATALDHLNSKLAQDKAIQETRTWRTILIESFSIPRNVEKFFRIRTAPQAAQKDSQSKEHITSNGSCSNNEQLQNGKATAELDQQAGDSFDRSAFLDSMSGLKCIGLIWIIAAHTFLVGPIPARNLTHTDKLTSTYLANVYLTANLMVDTFFALSGLLASYFIFKEGIGRIKPIQWLVLTVHRYWRLTPIYLLCYWYAKSLGHLNGSGPLWDYKTAELSPRLNCERESWATALLHLSDFKSPKEHCVPFAWFIANGIKFWMLTPLFLVLIHKSARRGYQLALGTILANIVMVGLMAFKSNLDMKSVMAFKPESANNMLNDMDDIYVRPYSRIATYLIGLLAGHLLYLVDTKQIRVVMTQNVKTTAWTLFSAMLILLTFIIKIAGNFEVHDGAVPVVFSVSSALMRPIWALCTCWLVFALAHGQVRWLRQFMAAKIWQILVKLSFCAYLFQGEVIALVALSQPATSVVTYSDLITFPMIVVPITMFASFLGVIILEYPLVGIEELILPKRKPTHTEHKSQKDQLVASGSSSTNGCRHSCDINHTERCDEKPKIA